MKFFVYGTLKEGGFFADSFNGVRISSVPATLPGAVLYDFGEFPGMVEGDGQVVGELHQYTNEHAVLHAFDQIEGYDPNDLKYSLYKRVEVEVVLENGQKENAIAYMFNGLLPRQAKKIESGVWALDGVAG